MVTTEDNINQFEQCYGVKMPKDFREMLIRIGGFESEVSFGENEYSKLILPLPEGKFGYHHMIFSGTTTFVDSISTIKNVIEALWCDVAQNYGR